MENIDNNVVGIKDSIMQIDHMCPDCSHFPLEYEDFSFERVIFCSRCDYEITRDNV